jgi:hypothetical protein
MRRAVLNVGAIASLAVIAIVALPSLMRVPSPEEVVPVLAKQELNIFRFEFEQFKQTHDDRPPGSLAELLADGHYLDGVVEPNRSRILRQMEYPMAASHAQGLSLEPIAAYHVAGFGDFFLLPDGTVVERRLPGYTAASYRKAQRIQMDAIKSQQDGAGNSHRAGE